MRTEIFDYLPDAARELRRLVFIEEQGFQNEFDGIDDRALHIVMYDGELPAAVCRVYCGDEKGEFILGRLAVRKQYRGRGTGAEMLREAEAAVKDRSGKRICLHAQCRAKDFYAKCGYCGYGEEDTDEGCPHIWMKKEIH